jgi:hypothetical protein
MPPTTPPGPRTDSIRRRQRLTDIILSAGVALVIGGALGAAGAASSDDEPRTVEASITQDQRDELIEQGEARAERASEGELTNARAEGAQEAAANQQSALDAARQQGWDAAIASQQQAASAAAAAADSAEVGPGTLVVGTDIAPGRYRTEAGADIMDSCYWARLSDLSGSFESIIANGNAQGATTIEVAASDAALETDCRWTPVG